MDAKQSRVRHLAKTITWRVVGTVDTILVGWLVSGDATMPEEDASVEHYVGRSLFMLDEIELN